MCGPDATRGGGTAPSEVGPDEVDDTPTDLAATAALIEAQRARVEQAWFDAVSQALPSRAGRASSSRR
ncbi:MAG: hypothetical protein JWP95_140 [Actinotalea sp.]|nr:hypothetical protein [Actinotalea sp.]